MINIYPWIAIGIGSDMNNGNGSYENAIRMGLVLVSFVSVSVFGFVYNEGILPWMLSVSLVSSQLPANFDPELGA